MFRRLGDHGKPSAPLLPCRAVSSRAEGALTLVSNRSLGRILAVLYKYIIYISVRFAMLFEALEKVCRNMESF